VVVQKDDGADIDSFGSRQPSAAAATPVASGMAASVFTFSSPTASRGSASSASASASTSASASASASVASSSKFSGPEVFVSPDLQEDGLRDLLREREQEMSAKQMSSVEKEMQIHGIAPIFDPVRRQATELAKIDFSDMRSFVSKCVFNRVKPSFIQGSFCTHFHFLLVRIACKPSAQSASQGPNFAVLYSAQN
jgi:hypothetical protein